MYTDLNAYMFRIQILQTLNIAICGIIAILSIIIPYLIFKNIQYIFIGFLIGAIVSYITYAINQLKLDKYKLQMDIYLAIIDEKENI